METTKTIKSFQIQQPAVKSIKQLPPKQAVARKITHEKRWKNCRDLLNDCGDVREDVVVENELQEDCRNVLDVCENIVVVAEKDCRNVLDEVDDNDNDNDNKKCIVLPVLKKTNKSQQSQQQQNQTTNPNNPAVNPSNMSPNVEKELQVVCSLLMLGGGVAGGGVAGNSAVEKLLLSQLNRKRQGYKMQDIRKGLFVESRFIGLQKIMEMLRDCELKCVYCPDRVRLLYNNVRDPKQWSLDRIDNNVGHNADNVCVSCLSCNLKRKTTFHQLFMKSKKMVFVKEKDGGTGETIGFPR